MQLPATWDEYLAGLRKRDRHELRRKLRRLERTPGTRNYELSGPGEVEAGMDDFFALHRMSGPDKQQFMTPRRERFFRRVAVRLAEQGIARLSFVEIDGERTAVSLSFVCGGVRYLYNSGYDPSLGRLAAGLLNHAYAIRRSIEEGLSVFDFMRGDEPYKYRLGGRDTVLHTLTATR